MTADISSFCLMVVYERMDISKIFGALCSKSFGTALGTKGGTRTIKFTPNEGYAFDVPPF